MKSIYFNNNEPELVAKVVKDITTRNVTFPTILKYLNKKCPYHGEPILFNQCIQLFSKYGKVPSDSMLNRYQKKYVSSGYLDTVAREGIRNYARKVRDGTNK